MESTQGTRMCNEGQLLINFEIVNDRVVHMELDPRGQYHPHLLEACEVANSFLKRNATYAAISSLRRFAAYYNPKNILYTDQPNAMQALGEALEEQTSNIKKRKESNALDDETSREFGVDDLPFGTIDYEELFTG